MDIHKFDRTYNIISAFGKLLTKFWFKFKNTKTGPNKKIPRAPLDLGESD